MTFKGMLVSGCLTRGGGLGTAGPRSPVSATRAQKTVARCRKHIESHGLDIGADLTGNRTLVWPVMCSNTFFSWSDSRTMSRGPTAPSVCPRCSQRSLHGAPLERAPGQAPWTAPCPPAPLTHRKWRAGPYSGSALGSRAARDPCSEAVFLGPPQGGDRWPMGCPQAQVGCGVCLCIVLTKPELGARL